MSVRVLGERGGGGRARLTAVSAAGETDEGGGAAAAAPAGSPPGLAGVVAAAGLRGRVVDGHLSRLRGGALLALAVLRLHILQKEPRRTAAGHSHLVTAATRSPCPTPTLVAAPLPCASSRVAILLVARSGAGFLVPRGVVWAEAWVATVEGRGGGGGGGRAGGGRQHAHLVGGRGG